MLKIPEINIIQPGNIKFIRFIDIMKFLKLNFEKSIKENEPFISITD